MRGTRSPGADSEKGSIGSGLSPGGKALDTEVWDRAVEEGEIEVVEGKKLIHTTSGIEVGTLEPIKQGVVTNLKIVFASYSPPKVTLSMAELVLHAVYYINSGDRLTPGQRTCTFRVRDKENPTEGKTKLTLDVARSIVVLQPAQLKRSAPLGVSYEMNIFDRPQVNIGDGKGSDTLKRGYTLIEMVDGFADGDTIGLAPGSGVMLKEGSLYVGVEFLGKLTSQTPTRLKLDHSWTSKATSKTMGQYISSVSMKTSRLAPARDIIVELTVYDGRFDPCKLRVVVSVAKQ